MGHPWRVKLDQQTPVDQACTLEVGERPVLVATRWGLVVVEVLPGWVWYRWLMGGVLWSATQERPRTARGLVAEAQRLIRDSRRRLRNQNR